MNPLSLITSEATLVLQGITGRQGASQVQRLLGSGTRLIAGVAPGHAGEFVDGVPVFDTVADAMVGTNPQIAMILVPPSSAPSAVHEAFEAGIKVIVLITEHIATQTTLDLVEEAKERDIHLIGPNTAGLILPGRIKIGIMAHEMYLPGRIALLSRSGTLMSEVAHQLTQRGIGQSICLDIGGDLIVGVEFVEVLEWLREDQMTEAVVVLGEIGGQQEEEVAAYLNSVRYPKPVYGLIVGHHAPQGKRMGHAGALVDGIAATAAVKTQRLAQAGVSVAGFVDELARLIGRDFGDIAPDSVNDDNRSRTQ